MRIIRKILKNIVMEKDLTFYIVKYTTNPLNTNDLKLAEQSIDKTEIRDPEIRFTCGNSPPVLYEH